MRRLGAAYLIHGLTSMLAAGIVSAACGSDSPKRAVRVGDGGAGGGAGEAPASAGEANPDPAAGRAGEPSTAGGVGGLGVGGNAAGAAGSPPLAMGGEGGSLPAIDCSTIAFDDAQLEAAVRDAIGKPAPDPILPADVVDLTTLAASGYGVQQLDGIECVPNLTVLELGAGGATSNVTNLEPLRYLKQLFSLDLSDNPLADLSPLADLPQLDGLDLGGSLDAGDDLTPLGAAPSLTSLNLAFTTLGDLTPLGDIETLVILELGNATLTKPESLAALTNVVNLQAANTVSDATPLAALTQLQHLYLNGKPLSNVTALATLVSLRVLDLRDTGITTLSFATNMSELTQLHVHFGAVTSVAPLQGLTKLNLLSLNYNPVSDISPLVANAGIGAGDTVNLAGTSIACPNADVTTLRGRGATVYAPAACN